MKYVFVRYLENYCGDSDHQTCVTVASGEAAESYESFIKCYDGGYPITIITWFEIPESWKNAVNEDYRVNSTFETLVTLDSLSETPVVSELLATIFEAGFNCGERHHSLNWIVDSKKSIS